MNLSGRPLLDNPADQALFAGRAGVLRRVDRALRSGSNCLLTGDPGSGKTTLVRALMYRSQDSVDRSRYAYVRGTSANTAADLLTAILAATRRPPGGRPVPAEDPIGLITRLAEQFANPDGMLPSQVVVVDDAQPAAALELFGALRDELWQVDARWLVTASSAHAGGLLRPPADVFFDLWVELAPLDPDEVAEVLHARLDQPLSEADEALVAAIARADPGTPRRLLEMAKELLAEPTVGGTLLTGGQGSRSRAAALKVLSRPARMLAQELDSLGWASASDERLLNRMGWTRPRVVQVIRELASRGLVQMREEKTGRGRPRKLYRLTPAAEFAPSSVDSWGTGSRGAGSSGTGSGGTGSGGTTS